MTENDSIDAKRYRAFRRLAIEKGSLEAFVACEQLDFVLTEESFDKAIDKAINKYLKEGEL